MLVVQRPIGAAGLLHAGDRAAVGGGGVGEPPLLRSICASKASGSGRCWYVVGELLERALRFLRPAEPLGV